MGKDRKIEDAVEGNLTVRRFISELTPEQFDVLYGLVDGKTIKEIAALNDITPNEVKKHRLGLEAKALQFLKG